MNEIIVIITIPIFLTLLWWVFIKKSKTFLSDKTKELLLGLSAVLVLIEVFAIWARFIAPQYVVKEINGDEIYRTWIYEKALKVYYAEREKRKSDNIILLDEDWGNSLWDWDEDPSLQNQEIDEIRSVLYQTDKNYSIYEMFIDRNNINRDNLCYSYIYIDSDTIPEMIINSGSESGGYIILSKQDNEIIRMDTWRLDFDYIEKTGLCAYQNGKQGHFYTHVWQLSKGKFEKILDVETYDDGVSGTCFYNDKEYDFSKGEELYMQLFRNKGNIINVDSIKGWRGFPQID